MKSFRIPLLALSLAISLSACSGGAEEEKGQGQAKSVRSGPLVVVSSVEPSQLIDSTEAVGTALANEQAELYATVTERIERINFKDGQYVPRGAIIAELVRSEESASLRENQARLTEATLQLARLKELQAKGFATNARVEQQQAAVDVARAQAAQTNSQISERVIRAPFSGWLSLRRVSPGAVTSAGSSIVTIVDHSRIKLDLTVPEAFIGSLKPGLAIEAQASAYPGETFRGTISSIDPLIDPSTRSATARAILPNPDLRLRPGMLLTVSIQSPARTVLTVPETALIGEGSGAFVWLVDDKNIATRHKVVTGTRRDGVVEIISGLKQGDRIVSEGTIKMRGEGPVTPGTAAALAKEAAEA